MSNVIHAAFTPMARAIAGIYLAAPAVAPDVQRRADMVHAQMLRLADALIRCQLLQGNDTIH
ncbi:hypothetical protein LG197_26220 [Pseudomonas asiatica]|uniref:hypothetical protein n=1 Tax=Pseudomonas asiatica TaxID=2219225 RepID=UPI0023675012|nr:hypothetical protein [Pseudomonas asiatica]WDM88049.1 hypothetical protein LG197_26220 [Pseudomonas asiatica]